MNTAPLALTDSNESHWSKIVLYWSDVAYFLGIWVAVFAFGPRNWIWVAGLAFGIASFILWIIARRQLGKSFSIRAEARSLVTTGLYRWFSHPIYLFGTLSHLGVVLAFQQWWLLPIWFGFSVPIQWARIRREDAILEAQFGAAFRRLRQRTIL